MAIEYSLFIRGKKITLKELKDLFSHQGIEISSTSNNHEVNYHLTDFKPNIGIQITVNVKRDFPSGHPANAIDTIFLKEEFIHDFTVTFRHDKFYEDTVFQNRIMYAMVFEIVEYLDCTAILFGPGGGDICYLSIEGDYFIKENAEWIENECRDVMLNRKIAYFNGDPIC